MGDTWRVRTQQGGDIRAADETDRGDARPSAVPSAAAIGHLSALVDGGVDGLGVLLLMTAVRAGRVQDRARPLRAAERGAGGGQDE